MADFQLDRAHTNVNFSAKHLMVTNVRGEFLDFDATVDLDEAEPTDSSVEFRVRTASVDTGFAARDNHLRSADFFDAETYPELVVRSTRVRHKRGNDYTVTADVTIRDVTRPVGFDVEFLGFFPGMDGARHVGFSAKARVNRKDWGLDWNVALEAGGWLVGDEIRIDVEVAAQERRREGGLTAAGPQVDGEAVDRPVEVDDVELARLVLAERADVEARVDQQRSSASAMPTSAACRSAVAEVAEHVRAGSAARRVP